MDLSSIDKTIEDVSYKITIFQFSKPEQSSADYVVIGIVADSDLFRPGGGACPPYVDYFVLSEHPVSHGIKRHPPSPALKGLFPDVIEELLPCLPD